MRKRSAGYILIQALVAVAGLLALMAILAGDERVTINGIQAELDRTRAEEADQSGIAQALAVLSTANENEVTLNDTWSTLGSSGNEEFDFPDGTSFRMQIIDASSLINLNTATQTQLQTLPLQQDQVDSLLDWIQTGTTARTDGAKDAFYNSLPQPYNTKLGPLTTVNELLLIHNWTGQTIYQAPTTSTTLTLGTDQYGNTLPLAALFTVDSGAPNTSSTGAALVNLSTRNVSANSLRTLGVTPAVATYVAAHAPYTSFAQLFGPPPAPSRANPNPMNLRNLTDESQLLNAATFSTGTRTTGKINLNTATQPVLQTVTNLPTSAASSIIAQQSTAYPSLGQWALSSGLTSAQIANVADSFTVGSDTWLVRIYGESGAFDDPEEAVVGYRSGVLTVVSVTPLHTAGIPSWWDWQTQTTSTEQAGVTQ